MLVAGARGGRRPAGGRSGRPWPTRCCCGPNYRGEQIPTAIGVVAVLAYVAVVAACGAARRARVDRRPVAATSSPDLVLPAVLGFALLGLFDDLAGSGHRRGFARPRRRAAGRAAHHRHAQAGSAARLVAVAVVAALPRRPQPGWLLLDAALVALAANLANLLDRAPGRTTKVGARRPCGAGRSATRARGPSWPVRRWPSAPAAGLLGPELRERAMLGDTGANAARRRRSGVGVVLDARPGRGAWACSSSCSVLNLASEWVSFSRVIDAYAAAALVRPPRSPLLSMRQSPARSAATPPGQPVRGAMPSPAAAWYAWPPVAKHIFVTGGVASSLGKGLTASSLGRLLKARGLRVTMQKLDPYINVDPGTMNPFEHGEVFVTDDGGETDLDLGHYERFIDENLLTGLERHDGLDLPVGAGRRAPRRLPGPHRPGHPAHHRRDQAAHPPPGHRRRRRRDHRGRWHRR